MIRLQAISFGFGELVGIVKVLGEGPLFSPLDGNDGCALALPFLPNEADFIVATKSPGVEFLIVPLCSSYSHFAATIWSGAIPTMAIQQTWKLQNGMSVLADFDNGVLIVAESEAEAGTLRKKANEAAAARQTSASGFRQFSASRSPVAVLGEASSAGALHRALADGADGLGVIKAEQLFRDLNGDGSGSAELIRAVKTNRQLCPLLVRFFDPDDESGEYQEGVHLPERYLGYRGVRILEVDDTWFQRFVAGLEMLDLDQIVIVLPMVTSVTEVRRFRGRFGPKWNQLGITVETPAAALRIEELLEVSDFVEIGVNDLTQYTMAWDRDVPNQERLPTDRIVEPVADLIARVAAACSAGGVPYTLGIDLRPNEVLAGQIIKLGITSISCVPPLVKHWKYAFDCARQPFAPDSPVLGGSKSASFSP